MADQRPADRHPILRQIGERHAALARVAEFAAPALLRFDDGARDRAAVEGIGALGCNQLQGLRQGGLDQPVALGQRHAAGTESCRGFRLDPGAAVVVRDVLRQETIDAKTVFGEFDRGGQRVGQLHRAPTA